MCSFPASVALYGLLLWVRSVAVVSSLMTFFFERCGQVVHVSHLVEREVSADGQAEGFYGVYLIPIVALVPDLHHRLLNDILGFRTVESDAERQPEELILQRQHVGLKTDFFHLSINNDVSKKNKLHKD